MPKKRFMIVGIMGSLGIVLCAVCFLYSAASSDKNIVSVTITSQPGNQQYEMTDQKEIASFMEGIHALDLEKTSVDAGEFNATLQQTYDIVYENGKTAQYYMNGGYFGEKEKEGIQWYQIKEDSK